MSVCLCVCAFPYVLCVFVCVCVCVCVCVQTLKDGGSTFKKENCKTCGVVESGAEKTGKTQGESPYAIKSQSTWRHPGCGAPIFLIIFHLLDHNAPVHHCIKTTEKGKDRHCTPKGSPSNTRVLRPLISKRQLNKHHWKVPLPVHGEGRQMVYDDGLLFFWLYGNTTPTADWSLLCMSGLSC